MKKHKKLTKLELQASARRAELLSLLDGGSASFATSPVVRGESEFASSFAGTINSFGMTESDFRTRLRKRVRLDEVLAKYLKCPSADLSTYERAILTFPLLTKMAKTETGGVKDTYDDLKKLAKYRMSEDWRREQEAGNGPKDDDEDDDDDE